MLRVLQINTVAQGGSVPRIAEEIGQSVLFHGGESYVAYGRGEYGGASQPLKMEPAWEVYTHVLQTRLFDRHGLGSVRATRGLIQHIENLQPDIIHLHNIHGYYLNYKHLFDCLAQVHVPIVWTLHDCWAYTGHCAYYSAVGCERWKKQCMKCPVTRAYPGSWGIDRSQRNFEDKKRAFTLPVNMTLVAVSHWLAGQISQSFLCKYPVRVIRNGVDTQLFQPQRSNKSDLGLEDKFCILGVANVWSDRKGLADFIELRRRLPEDFQIVLIGLSREQIAGLPRGIMGIERTQNVQQLAQYYSVADVYVNASVEETLGLTTVEALSCGTPAIVYNATACPEPLSKETGCVVAANDTEAIARLVAQLKSGSLRFEPGDCRERVLTHFEKHQQTSEYWELYRELIAAQRDKTS